MALCDVVLRSTMAAADETTAVERREPSGVAETQQEAYLRELTSDDAEAMLGLTVAVGWTNTLADLQLLLRCGRGFGVFQGPRLLSMAAITISRTPAVIQRSS